MQASTLMSGSFFKAVLLAISDFLHGSTLIVIGRYSQAAQSIGRFLHFKVMTQILDSRPYAYSG